jgi:outer membrane receptor protein involved in Fe transport
VDLCPLQKTLDGVGLTANDTIRSLEGTQSSHFNTPKVTLNWQVTPDNLVYFFWARAQKPGGISVLTAGGSAVTLETERFAPEKLQAWELGTKNLFDVAGPLQANASFFFQDYTDKQVTTQIIDENGVSQPRVLNASGAEIWGAELDFLWQPDFLEGFSLNLSYTYLDAEYTRFLDDVTSPQRLAGAFAAGRDCTLIYKGIDAAGNQVSSTGFDPAWFNGGVSAAAPFAKPPSAFCQVDYSGAKLERTPEHSVAVGASYQRPLLDTGLDLLAEVNANWQDKRYLDQENALYFDSYWLVNARLGLVHPQYEIIAYVDNVLDDDTLRSGGSGPDFARQVAETGFTGGLGVSHYFGSLPDPRIFGVRATYRFGGE